MCVFFGATSTHPKPNGKVRVFPAVQLRTAGVCAWATMELAGLRPGSKCWALGHPPPKCQCRCSSLDPRSTHPPEAKVMGCHGVPQSSPVFILDRIVQYEPTTLGIPHLYPFMEPPQMAASEKANGTDESSKPCLVEMPKPWLWPSIHWVFPTLTGTKESSSN